MQTDRPDTIQIGEWLAIRSRNEVHSDSGTYTISPRSMEVLWLLANQPDRTFSADEILQRVWEQPYVGDNAVHKAISELRQVFKDDVRRPQYIATVRKRGYRLVAAVNRDLAPDSQIADTSTAGSSRKSARFWGTVVLIAAALSAIAVVVQIRNAPPPELTYPPGDYRAAQIAVLSFKEDSSENANGYIGVGLSNALMRAFTSTGAQIPSPERVRELLDSGLDPIAIGEQLGVLYVVSGNYTLIDGAVRVIVQVDDVTTQQRVWIERFQSDASDLFELEDEISAAARLSLSERIQIAAAPQVARGTQNADAYVAYLRGGQRQAGCRGWALAQADYERAVELDPDFVDARLLGGRAMGVRATLCGESSFAQAMWFAGSALNSEKANPFVRATVQSARAFDSADKARALEEAFSMPVLEYEQWIMNALERPRPIEYEYGALLLGAGLYEAAADYYDLGRRLEKQRDGSIPISSMVVLAEPYFFAGDFARCVSKGTEEIEAREALIDHPLSESRLARMLCASKTGQKQFLTEDLQHYRRQLAEADTLARDFGLESALLEERIRFRIDAVLMEQAINADGRKNVRDRFDFESRLPKPMLTEFARYVLLRTAEPDELFRTLESYANFDGGRGTNRIFLRGMMEQLRPELLADTRYLDLLERYDIPESWKNDLCVRAAALEIRTGVSVVC